MYIVLGAISLGVGYIIREAFFGGAKKTKVRFAYMLVDPKSYLT